MMTWVAEWSEVIVAYLVALRTVQVGTMVKYADPLLKVTEFTVTAIGVCVAPRATFAVCEAKLAALRAGAILVTWHMVVVLAARLRYAAPVVDVTPETFTAGAIGVAGF